jgi:hypothetical protein
MNIHEVQPKIVYNIGPSFEFEYTGNKNFLYRIYLLSYYLDVNEGWYSQKLLLHSNPLRHGALLLRPL